MVMRAALSSPLAGPASGHGRSRDAASMRAGGCEKGVDSDSEAAIEGMKCRA